MNEWLTGGHGQWCGGLTVGVEGGARESNREKLGQL